MDWLNVIDRFAQAGVWVSLLAAWMVRKKNKWGFVVGLCGQPFWFYTTIYHHQWLVTLLVVLHTYNWFRGTVEWFRDDPKRRQQANGAGQ